ncbi:MAG TPA: sugar ABC transporter permease, partial [Burkholderiales bacterium]|nr:sugar ABC transporter permease [Burkholderiales bacterium]
MNRPAAASSGRSPAASAALLAPACALFAAFVLYPIGANLWLSLHDWDGAGARAWVGLGNYRELLADPTFRTAVANNLRWLALYLVAAPALGLAAALLLSQALAGMRLARALFFMPFVISQVVVALVFGWFFHTRFGLLNGILDALGLPPLELLDSGGSAIYALIIAGLWPQTAYCMILY